MPDSRLCLERWEVQTALIALFETAVPIDNTVERDILRGVLGIGAVKVINFERRIFNFTANEHLAVLL